jgi:hypothetical protein
MFSVIGERADLVSAGHSPNLSRETLAQLSEIAQVFALKFT